MEKYIFKDFPDKTTPFSANVFNEIQDNIETEINNSGVVVSATEPQGESRKKVWIQKGKNLFNKDNVLTGYRLDYSGGNFADTNYFISEYIPVVANQKYSVNYVVSALNRVCWYDSNKTMINYTNTYSTVEMPSNAKYIRLCGEKSALDTVQLEQNDTSSPYEAYVEPKIYILNNNGVYEEFVRENKDEYIVTNSEYKTNQYIDGKRVYRKRISTGTLPNNTYKNILTGLSNIDIIKAEGIVKNSSGNAFPLPFVTTSGLNNNIQINFTSNGANVQITTGMDRSSYSGYIDIYYTKTDASVIVE